MGDLVFGNASGCAQNAQTEAEGQRQGCDHHRHYRCLQHKGDIVGSQIFFQQCFHKIPLCLIFYKNRKQLCTPELGCKAVFQSDSG